MNKIPTFFDDEKLEYIITNGLLYIFDINSSVDEFKILLSNILMNNNDYPKKDFLSKSKSTSVSLKKKPVYFILLIE